MSGLERLVLLQAPEIADASVRAELNWQGLDRAARLLGELAMDELQAIPLAPTPNGVVYLRRHQPGEESAWNAAGVRGREALAIGIGQEDAAAAVAALATLASGGSAHPAVEVPVRLDRPGGEFDGVLTLTGPSGARPPGSPAHAALQAHVLEATPAGSLVIRLLWPHVADWQDRIAGNAAALAIVDEASRTAALEWSPNVSVPGIGRRDGVTVCSLPLVDAETLGAFLRQGIGRGAFPVDHVDFQTGDGPMLTVVVPFDRATARFAS